MPGKRFCLLLAAVLLWLCSQGAATVTCQGSLCYASIYPAESGFTCQDEPLKSFKYCGCQSSAVDAGNCVQYEKFDLNFLPETAVIMQAKLYKYSRVETIDCSLSEPLQFSVFAASQNWGESISYGSLGRHLGYDASSLFTVEKACNSSTKCFNCEIHISGSVESVVQQWVNGAKPNYGFAFVNSAKPAGWGSFSFWFRNAADEQKPRLSLEYSLPGCSQLNGSVCPPPLVCVGEMHETPDAIHCCVGKCCKSECVVGSRECVGNTFRTCIATYGEQCSEWSALTPCSKQQYCSSGICMPCDAGTMNCDNDAANGCEVDLNTDIYNCGGCGSQCRQNMECVKGECACRQGFYDCDGLGYNGCEQSEQCEKCDAGVTRQCTTSSGCKGMQTCVNGAWESCRVFESVCPPNETVECSPIVNGIVCGVLGGTQVCGPCGDSLSECVAPPGIECCPKQKTNCFVGSMPGYSECSKAGRWESCRESGIECFGVECADRNPCTADYCFAGECRHSAIPGCEPVLREECVSDGDCESSQKCVLEKCVELECSECQMPENHACVNKTGGKCCSGRWNPGVDSCTVEELAELLGVSEQYKDDAVKRLRTEAEASLALGNVSRAKAAAYLALAKAKINIALQAGNDVSEAVHAWYEAENRFGEGNYADAIGTAVYALDQVAAQQIFTLNLLYLSIAAIFVVVAVTYVFGFRPDLVKKLKSRLKSALRREPADFGSFSDEKASKKASGLDKRLREAAEFDEKELEVEDLFKDEKKQDSSSG